MAKSKKKDEKQKDPRIVATESIMAMSIALLALCVPLVGMLKSALLPALVICSAGAATGCVWYFGRPKAKETESDQTAELKATVRELQERLENVEVINRFETTLAERTLAASTDETGEADSRAATTTIPEERQIKE